MEENESADERYRHGEERNESGTPTLEKNVNNDDDEDDGDHQGDNNFLDALGDGLRGVEGNYVIDIAREAQPGFHHQFFQGGGGLHCVGARQLVSGDDGAGFSVEAAEDAVALRAKFDASDVFEAHHTTERRFA